MDFRKKALDALAWEIAHENIGIYAKAVHGEGGYEQRSERMEGWNECAIAHSKKACAVRGWMKDLPTEHKTTIEDLLLQGIIDIYVRGDAVTMAVNCNDLFFWGCADSEDLEASELGDLCQAIQDAAAVGADSCGELLWVARKRKERPQGAYYAHVAPGLGKLFDQCGEHRPSEFGNPVASSFEAGEAYREKRTSGTQ